MTRLRFPKTAMAIIAAAIILPAAGATAADNSGFIAKSASDSNIRAAATSFEKGDYAKSVAFSKAALRASMSTRRQAIAYTNLCAAYGELGDMERANIACDKALELRPGYEAAEDNKAALTIRLAEITTSPAN